MKQVRCAIYTRKSTEEGLEQAFNSLDAQREACAAYILSQASEGWTLNAGVYDDGGVSGGTLERPGLQRLLAEVRDGNIDIIVVYKVDRLTRSLLDFAKLVETFDKVGVSFVSITQSFNTTTSMGRLTLNMLLSFAQFEREVIAERVRDKIAASKAKGMWMGGNPPLGYAPNGRTLSVVEEHANLVRDIFQRYVSIPNVRLLREQLERERIWAPSRTTISGKTMGGRPLSRGQLYNLLKNRIYVGEIEHRGNVYPGQHPAIIDRELWDQVQAVLANNVRGTRDRVRATEPSLLAGKIIDEAGKPLTAAHACKGTVRYRYYVGRALQHATGDAGIRIPAREIEGVVIERVAQFLSDSVGMIAAAWLEVRMEDYGQVTAAAHRLASCVRGKDRSLITSLVEEVRLERGNVHISCNTAALAAHLQVSPSAQGPAIVTLSTEAQLKRTGKAMRLVDQSGSLSVAQPNPALVRLVAQVHRLWGILRSEQIDITRLAEREGISPAYLSRVLPLAFLAPRVTEAILDGTQLPHVNVRMLTLDDGLDIDWRRQSARMLASA